jgi:hypothetical protein
MESHAPAQGGIDKSLLATNPPHPRSSAISLLISLTHRALPDVLLQESAGIGCADFEPFIIPGYSPSSLCVVGIFLIFASIGAGHISLHRGLYSTCRSGIGLASPIVVPTSGDTLRRGSRATTGQD